MSTPALPTAAILWEHVLPLFAPTARIVDLEIHEYDLSVELFFAPDTAATWVPAEAALKAVCALGVVNVYCVFADETEFVGGWRSRKVDGRTVAGADQWVMSPRREKTGTPRYGDHGRPQARLLRGEDAALWPEFIAWKVARR